MTFEEDVRTVIEKEIEEMDKMHLKCSKRYFKGVSGNYWTPDIVIEDTTEKAPESIKVMIECKGPGYETGVKPQPHTFREHMLRAYSELGDLRNYKIPKFLVVSYMEDTRVFDYKAYFESICVEIVDWDHFYTLENKLLTVIGEL